MKKTLLSLSLVVFFFFLMPRKIDINVSDLGRHLKNGEIFITQGKIIESNYYSYTEPYIPVVNHHWLSGGIFFIVYRHFGFIGLSVFFCLIMAFAVYLMFLVAQRRTNSLISLTLVLFSIIFILSRLEIRPEGFSFLFLAVFIYLLDFFTASKKNFRLIFFVLLVLQMLWVNLHIFFILGPLITGAYFLGAVLDHDWIYAKKLGTLLFFLPLGSLANPWGFSGLLEPINIFVGYDIPVIENRSIFNAVLLNPGSKIVTDFLTYFLLLFIFAVFSPLFFKKSYQKKNTYIWLFLFFCFLVSNRQSYAFRKFFWVIFSIFFGALIYVLHAPAYCLL